MGTRPESDASSGSTSSAAGRRVLGLVVLLVLLGLSAVAVDDLSDDERPFPLGTESTPNPAPRNIRPRATHDALEIPDFQLVDSYLPPELARVAGARPGVLYGFEASPALQQPILGIFLGELLSDAVARHGASRFRIATTSHENWGSYVHMASTRPELYRSVRMRVWEGRIVDMLVCGLQEPDAFRDGLKRRFGAFDYRDWTRPVLRIDGQAVSMSALYINGYELRLDQIWSRIDKHFKADRIDATRRLVE